MSRRRMQDTTRDRGFCAIGIAGAKTEANVGTLWRSASILGASYIFTVGHRYGDQRTDTTKAWRHIPFFTFDTMDDLDRYRPRGSELIGIELDDRAIPLDQLDHPQRAVYVLGAEDHGLAPADLMRCDRVVRLPGEFSMNVAAAGSIVLYDRLAPVEATRREAQSA